MRKTSRRTAIGLLAVAFLVLSSALPAAADEPGQSRGFAAKKVYDFQSGIDTVNTFQGNLSLQLPIGPSYPVGGSLAYSLGLAYNSKVWDYENYNHLPRALANRRSNAGLGWLLSLGRLILPEGSTNNLHAWIYESPDGADHDFWETLHQGDAEIPPTGSVRDIVYTRDGTYLRLVTYDFNHDDRIDDIEMEFPDGTVHRFDPTNGNLLSIRDRTGNQIDISYLFSLGTTPCPAGDNFAWLITDSQHQRTSYVCFKNLPYFDSTYPGQVERVVVTAPPSPSGTPRTTTYLFHYELTDIRRGCGSLAAGSSLFVEDVPLLKSVTANSGLPEEQAWQFGYNTVHGLACESGALSSYQLPTGATVSYEYRNWRLPVQQCSQLDHWDKDYTGIGKRTVAGPNMQTAEWTYASAVTRGPESTLCQTDEQSFSLPIPSEQMITTVFDPAGNVSEYFYSTWPILENSPRGFRRNEYGLPFTRKPGTEVDGRLLSQRLYSSAGYSANPKRPIRSKYVTYELDNTICTDLNEFCTESNGRLTSTRTVYHDDDRFADTVHSNYDGLGNMRQTVTGGNFTGNNVVTTYTGFNERNPSVNPGSGIDSGTYPGSFRMPTLSQPWILQTASSARTTEGTSTAVAHTCHDPLTGLLRATRTLKTTALGATDLLTTFEFDANGNVTSEAYAGGDVRNNAPTSGTLCATAGQPPAPDYTINHTYQSGMRVTSKYATASFLSLDLTVDRPSGVVLTSRDTSGVATGYEYDLLFRMRKVKPAGTASTTYDYFNASGSGPSAVPPRVEEKTVSAQGGTVESHSVYDALGRLWRTLQRMPGDTWSYTQTSLNVMGWPEWTSEWQALPASGPITPGSLTSYNGYDPFGRASSVVTPAGQSLFLQYRGASSLTRTVHVGMETGGQVKTHEVYDRHGRLVSVTEAHETASAVTTTYGYDVGGRLVSVSMPGPNGVQKRTLQYDNRGFLEHHDQPELGAAGNGRMRFLDYDARGHSRRQITGATNGAFDITLEFDHAERLTRTKETSSGKELNRFVYDGGFTHCSNNRCNGKVAAAGRYNHFDDLGMITVAEVYQYDGLGGRLSRRDTAVGSDDGVFEGQAFFDDQIYNDLGAVATVGYPCRKLGDQCAMPQRRVPNGYSNGQLTSVGSFASISYQPNGMPGTITHVNGVKDTFTPDPNGLPRPCSILTYKGSLQSSTEPCGFTIPSTSTVQWTSGTFNYDGAGNITRVGDTRYTYDPFKRLVRWRQNSADGSTNSTSVAYDVHGNYRYSTTEGCVPQQSGPPICAGNDILLREITGTTNHYVDLTYDAAGNVTRDLHGQQYTYDAFNKAKTFSSSGRQFRYVYGPDNERIAIVERVPTGRTTRHRTTWTLRGFNKSVLSSWRDDSTSGTRVWTWLEDEIFRGGALLASVSPTRTWHYSLDHLGSPRVVTDPQGALVGNQTFGPYGFGGTSDGGFLQFTGQERDAAILNGTTSYPDSFHARQYDKEGRFLSLDPGPPDAGRPQSWNRYVYALNNPLLYTDPTGMIFLLAHFQDANAEDKDQTEQAFFAQLSEKTGLTIYNNNGVLDYKRDENGFPVYTKDAKGRVTGSKSARNALMGAMLESKNRMIYRSDGTSHNTMGGQTGTTTFLDFADIGSITVNGIPAATFDSSMIFLHEAISHGYLGLKDPTDAELDRDRAAKGRAVEFDNQIRTELGLPIRTQYGATRINRLIQSIPFDGGVANTPRPPEMR